MFQLSIYRVRRITRRVRVLIFQVLGIRRVEHIIINRSSNSGRITSCPTFARYLGRGNLLVDT